MTSFTASAQNTTNSYTGTNTGSLLLGTNWSLGHLPSIFEDAVFTSLPGARSLTEGSLTLGSLNVTATTGVYSIQTLTTTSTNSTLTLGGAGNLGDAVSGSSSGDLIFVRSGGTLNIVGASGSTGSGVLGVVLGQSGNFDVAGTLNVSAAISDGGSGFSLNKTSGGTMTLSGINTYSGGTTISSGILSVSNIGNNGVSGNIGTGALVIGSASTGQLRYTGAGETTNRTITMGGASVIDTTGATGGLILTSNITATGAGNKTLLLQGNTTGNVIQGVISNTSPTVTTALTKAGSGTWTLAGNNTYTGGTVINAGTLIVNGSIAANIVGLSGATSVLSGTGSVPSIFAYFGGTISPGNGAGSIGTLTSGGFMMAEGGIYSLELQTDGTGTAGVNWDKLLITGLINNESVNLSTPFTLKLQTLTGSGAFGSLAAWNGSVNHTWASVLAAPGGWSTAFSSDQWVIDTTGFANSYTGTFSLVSNGTALDLVYTVPEPSAALSLLGGSGLLLLGCRRRNRR